MSDFLRIDSTVTANKNRILFWTGTFWPYIGGVEVLATKLLSALQQRGYEFVVVAPQINFDVPEKAVYNGIPVYRIPFWVGFHNIDRLAEIRQRVVKLKKSVAPNLVHINAANLSIFFHLITSKIDGAPLLVTLHGQWSAKANSLVRNILRAAEWVAGCSAAILEKGRQLAPEICNRSSVIHNALEWPSLSPEPLPSNPHRILCIGRLHPEKGFDFALQALPLILKRFPQAHLIIAGDGAERTNLERQTARLGINHAVEYKGWIARNAVLTLINKATLILMPSRNDSLPLVALEAALMSRPVVATRVGGLPEVVLHQQTGLLVEKGDINGLANSVIYLLENPETAIQMGQTSRNRSQEMFNWQRHVDAYDTLYQKLLNSDKPPFI